MIPTSGGFTAGLPRLEVGAVLRVTILFPRKHRTANPKISGWRLGKSFMHLSHYYRRVISPRKVQKSATLNPIFTMWLVSNQHTTLPGAHIIRINIPQWLSAAADGHSYQEAYNTDHRKEPASLLQAMISGSNFASTLETWSFSVSLRFFSR